MSKASESFPEISQSLGNNVRVLQSSNNRRQITFKPDFTPLLIKDGLNGYHGCQKLRINDSVIAQKRRKMPKVRGSIVTKNVTTRGRVMRAFRGSIGVTIKPTINEDFPIYLNNTMRFPKRIGLQRGPIENNENQN